MLTFCWTFKRIQCVFFSCNIACHTTHPIVLHTILQYLNIKRNFHLLGYIFVFAQCSPLLSSCFLIKCVYNGYKVHLIQSQLVFEIDIESLAHLLVQPLISRKANSRHWNIGTDINLQHQLNILGTFCFVLFRFVWFIHLLFSFFLFSGFSFFLLLFYPIENVLFILRFMLFHHRSHVPFHELHFLHDEVYKTVDFFYSKHGHGS